MNKKRKVSIISGIIITAFILAGFILTVDSKVKEITLTDEQLGAIGGEGTATFAVTDATSGIIIAYSDAALHRIVIGSTVIASDIAIYDNNSIGGNSDSNMVFRMTADNLKGVWDMDLYFSKGITTFITNQTNTLFNWSPR